MQILSLEIEAANEIAVYKRHGLHVKTQKPQIVKVPHRNEPTGTYVPASKSLFYCAAFLQSILFIVFAYLFVA